MSFEDHEITSTDTVAVVGQQAWHGLATVLPEAPNVWGAMQAAGLGWSIVPRPLIAVDQDADPREVKVDTHKALFRSDSKELLAVVGAGYHVLQNVDLATLIDNLGRNGSIPKIESAGSLRGGRDVFFCTRIGSFLAGGVDEVQKYLILANTNDSTGAFDICPSAIRTVCKNTLEAGKGSARVRFTIRHTKGMANEIQNAANLILDALEAHKDFEVAIQAMADAKLSTTETRGFFERVWTRINSVSIERLNYNALDAESRQGKRAAADLEAWTNAAYDDARQASVRGTVWGAVNAITQWVDHDRKGRVDSTYSKLFGPGRDIKAIATSEAFALITKGV